MHVPTLNCVLPDAPTLVIFQQFEQLRRKWIRKIIDKRSDPKTNFSLGVMGEL